MVEQHQAVPEGSDGEILKVVVLHGDGSGEFSCTDSFVGGPG